MFTPLRARTRLAALILCSLLLSLLFAACGGGSPASISTPTPPPTPTPTPTPTPNPTANLQNYPGADFSMGYPNGWKVTPGTNEVTFLDPTGNVIALVEAPDLGGNMSATALAGIVQQAIGQEFSNIQDDGAPATLQFAGENWSQTQVDGDAQDGTRGTILALSTLHQPTGGATKAYFLLFAAPKAQYDTDLVSYFRPMISSFQFT